MAELVAAIDQGTTSTRCLLVDRTGAILAVDQREHRQITPRPGWVEHDPLELWTNTQQCVAGALERAAVGPGDVVAVGITNQRETTVVWDRGSGAPVGNAIVWQDTRTAADALALGGEHGPHRLRAITGLPLSSYFSGPKIAWILDHVPGARERAERGALAFGTVDSWLLWNLTGGVGGGVHATDVTNASRTLLMDLETLDWSDEALALMRIPRPMLPPIRSSSEPFGDVRGTALAGRPVSGILGDQQAALFGQAAFEAGAAKNTYGTGSFLLVNTGEQLVRSDELLTSVAYRLGREPARYVLEGSIAVTGAAVQWLRDRLGLIGGAAEVEDLARTVPDNGGVVFVPAFSGLFAPRWRPDARGAILGLTAYAGRGHLARAVLEATAWQVEEVVEAVAAAGVTLDELRVDGGMTVNELLMQTQADVLGVPVVRPKVIETTALGAAYAAGLAVGLWAGLDELRDRWAEDHRWQPRIDAARRARAAEHWRQAVERTLDWPVTDDAEAGR